MKNFKDYYNLKELEVKNYDDKDSDVLNWNPPSGDTWKRSDTIKVIGDYKINVLKDGETLEYGVFLTTDNTYNCLASIGLDMTTDYSHIIGISTPVPIVIEIKVQKEYRGKGLAKILYKTVLDRHGILFSDSTIYQGAYKLWMDYIKSLPGTELYLFNYVDEWIKPYDDALSTEDINTRLLAVSSNRYKNSIKKLVS